MFDVITFFIHKNKIEINGNEFSLGELTVDFLNIDNTTYEPMHQQMELVKEKVEKYKISGDFHDWWELNNDFEVLDTMLMEYKVFQAIRHDKFSLFEETRQLTGQLSLLPDVDFELSESDFCFTDDVQEKIDNGEIVIDIFSNDLEYLGQFEHEEKTNAMLIYPGNKKAKWEYYEKAIQHYDLYLHDIRAFNETIHNFINYFLSALKKHDPENYAAALYDFYNSDVAYKLIANPIRRGGDIYTNGDEYRVTYLPREVQGKKDTFDIYEKCEVTTLQSLLKADYMKSMMAGYIIRKCRICKQYFMLKKAYHAMYCDKPSPVDARYTCHQIGSFKVEKELAGNIPKVGSKIRTYDRIEQDRRRGIITHKEERKLKDEVRDLLHEALTSPKISNDDFENMVQSEILYPKYNIVRKTKPRGRPKKQ